MKFKLIILLTLLTSMAFSAEFAGTSTESSIIHVKTRNGNRINHFVTTSFNFEGDQVNDDSIQMMECKFSKSVSNRFSFVQYNFSIYQGLYEAQNSESFNGLYDFVGINGSIIGALKFSIGRFELCYGLSLGCIAEAGDFIDFKDELTGDRNEPYQFYSGGYGAWNFHLNDDSYVSVQSTSNSNYLYKTNFLYQAQDIGFWFSIGFIENNTYEDEYYYDDYDSVVPCSSFGATFTF